MLGAGGRILTLAQHRHFVHDETMDVDDSADSAAAAIASAIADPARARMLYCLMDGHARTSTELAAVADIGASTASAHLGRLKEARLVKVQPQGKHRYYSLAGGEVADVLERLLVLAGGVRGAFVPSTPGRLRTARTCYDHLAGEVGVLIHDRFEALGFLVPSGDDGAYGLSSEGARALWELGVDIDATRAVRRKFAYGCLDWSHRRPHVGGALGAAVLTAARRRGWVTEDLDSRALEVTSRGRREMRARFGVEV